MAPILTIRSIGPPKKMCPSTVDRIIDPAAAKVFKIESAYFNVAAYKAIMKIIKEISETVTESTTEKVV